VLQDVLVLVLVVVIGAVPGEKASPSRPSETGVERSFNFLGCAKSNLGLNRGREAKKGVIFFE